MPAIPVLDRLRQEDHRLEASLAYIVRTYTKKQNEEGREGRGGGGERGGSRFINRFMASYHL
jgi:hypothetical protein